MDSKRQYVAIDLKSFYASVECVERGLDPLDTCLVVADRSRTEKTICLAVSPALKAFGCGARPRLFEVVSLVRDINRRRCPGGVRQTSQSARVLAANLTTAVDYIAAKPRMGLYIDYSTRIYRIYLRYIAPEDIHVYSIDEVFMDVTDYLKTYRMEAHELAVKIIREILAETGITATAGVGTNLYLAKVAMDIVAKHMTPDRDGVRIASLDEMTYRRLLWSHRPLTDFWRVGGGIARRLEAAGMRTMGDIARCSIERESLLYRLFGVNAQLLIDHAWGWEPVTISQIKAYRPEIRSLCSGQALCEPYDATRARTVVLEMADSLALDMLEKGVVTDQIGLYIGYDTASLDNPAVRAAYHGATTIDRYGREIPVHSNSSINLGAPTSSTKIIVEAVAELFDRITNKALLIRRINISANHVINECEITVKHDTPIQLQLFTDYDEINRRSQQEAARLDKERRYCHAIMNIKKRFGKNAILKGLNYCEGSTQRQRNTQIGGHNA